MDAALSIVLAKEAVGLLGRESRAQWNGPVLGFKGLML